MAIQSFKSEESAIAEIYSKNPKFDILHFDLGAGDAGKKLKLTKSRYAELLPALRLHQRLSRIEYVCNHRAGKQAIKGVATKLRKAGFHSAQAIARIPEHRFVQEHAGLFQQDEGKAKRVHHAARQIAQHTRHLLANVHNSVASPHFRSMRSGHGNGELSAYFTDIPGYQDLFGNLNFLGGDQCNSIFSPAAYFLDLMRLVDDYVTNDGANTIPVPYQLSTRRPDLFEMELTCAKSFDLVPYLDIVNEVIERRISDELKKLTPPATKKSVKNRKPSKVHKEEGFHQIGEPWQSLAIAKYPFNLPFHFPLTAIRQYAANLGSALTDVYRWFAIPADTGNVIAATANTIQLAASSSKDANVYVSMQVVITAGKGVGQSRTIVSYPATTQLATVDRNWNIIPDNTSYYHIVDTLAYKRESLKFSVEQYKLFITPQTTDAGLAPYYGLTKIDLTEISKVGTFLSVTGLTWKELEDLLVQGLSNKEFDDGLSLGFYINNTGEADPAMKIVTDKTNPAEPIFRIANLTLLRLDRLNRFIRLAAQLAWPYAALNTALASVDQGNDISVQTIQSLASIESLRQTSGFAVEELCALWSTMKTTGKGNGPQPADLFDRVFNNPALLHGKDPYAPGSTTPFNSGAVIDWEFEEKKADEGIIRSRLCAALFINDTDLLLLARKYYEITGRTDNKIRLDLSSLSWFYRFTKAASFFKLKIDAFLKLMQLVLNIPADGKLAPADFLLSIEQMTWLWEQSQGASQLPFTIYELNYIVNEASSPFYKPPYTNSEIVTLLENLWTSSATARLKVQDFSFGNALPDRAKNLFDALLNKFINSDGICLNDETSFTTAAAYYPLTVTDFTVGNILPKEAKDVFDQLQASHPPILITVTGKVLLSESYSDQSNLDFLFPNDADGENKRNLVRSILNRCNEKIALQEFAFLFALNENSFVNDIITTAESKEAFALLLKSNPPGSDSPILIPSGSDGLLNASFNAETPLDFLFSSLAHRKNNKAGDALVPADAVLKRSMVREVLLAHKRDITYVAEVMSRAEKTQDQLIVSGLAVFLQTTPEYVTTMLPFILGESSMDDFRSMLLAPLVNGQTDTRIYEFISITARSCVLFTKLGYTAREIAAVINIPDAFNIETSQPFSLYNIQCMAAFKKLQRQLSDRTNTLISCFYMPNTPEGDKATAYLLTGLAGWNTEQLLELASTLHVGLTCTDSFSRMATCFGLSDQMMITTGGLLQLMQTGKLPLLDSSEKFDAANWDSYCDQWDIVQGAVSVAAEKGFDALNAGSAAALNSAKRNALLKYAIWLLNAGGVSMKTPNDLYQYLLIDVEMGGCDSISYIAQGISSVQLYLQRCRMMLEEGVNNLQIKEVWWKWISAYRMWEANRKIFLYPENYIDPALRKDTTPLFATMVDELLQTNIDDQSMESVYRNYFAGLSDLASLSVCESFEYTTTEPGVLNNKKTLFVFGRTNKQPYVYYYRSLDDQSGWTPWQKLDIVINSMFISPVFAFNQLFIFWAETRTIESSVMTGSATVPLTTESVTLRYSFLDEQQNWVQPQDISGDMVTCFKINYAFDDIVDPAMKILKIPFDTRMAQWKAPYAFQVPTAAFLEQNLQPATEGIVLLYGPRVAVSKTSNESPKPAVNLLKSPAQVAFDSAVLRIADEYNDLQKLTDSDSKSLAVMVPIYLDNSLSRQDIPSYYPDNQPGQNCPTYRATLKRDSNQLSVVALTMSNVIDENYYTDDFAGCLPSEAITSTGYPILNNISGANASIIAVKNRPYHFILDNGDEAFLVEYGGEGLPTISEQLKIVAPTTTISGARFSIVSLGNFSTNDATTQVYKFTRLNTTVVSKLNAKLITMGIDGLLTVASQQTPELDFSRLKPVAAKITQPATTLDFNGSYGIYFWETFFHAPFLAASTLSVNKRHADALRWYQYIFNPTQKTSTNEPGKERFWRFLPFRTMTIEDITEILTNPWQIAAYNNKPFDPDAIARLRTSAYAKTIVMHYIDNLIAWADQLYEQDTRESITEAVNLYVMAADLLGPRPQQTGELKKPAPKNFNDIKAEYDNKTVMEGTAVDIGETYIILDAAASGENDAYDGMHITVDIVGVIIPNYIVRYDGTTRKAILADKWITGSVKTAPYRIYKNGIPEFLVRLENTPPALVSAQHVSAVNSELPFNDINSYFSIPENRDFIAYWDKVDDRLFKIRNCMNKAGVVRQLALYEPPIDPRMAGALADRETGAGGQAEVPVYRFQVMIEKAKSFASNVMSLGGSLLSILEKKDAEALALLRATQETAMLNLITFMKEQQVEDVAKQRLALNESLTNARIRYDYYTNLVAKGLIDEEKANIISTKLGLVFSVISEAVKTMSAIGYAVPQAGSPFAMTYGGQQIGASLTAFSGVLDIGTLIANFNAQLSLTMAGYKRREQEWSNMAALASSDMAQIQYQLQSNEIAQAIAAKDLENHLVSIQQSKAIELFLEDKFTNIELYQWLLTKMSGIYFQTYTLAYELALATQNAFQFEMNVNNTFVSFGYWSNLQKGLGAGESLMLALNQMEKAFIDGHARPMEIQKTISLAQLDPMELLKLTTKGECVFDLKEKLFDDDFPGHYARKIKTISISIPVVVGPYQNIKATLTQLSNQIILKPVPNAVEFLLGEDKATMPDADTLRSNWQVNQQIALSTGNADNGMFELRFDDDRYLPFEGTGAVSLWRLSMPKASNRIDFSNVTDVVIQLKYTAFDGGSLFRKQVTDIPAMKVYNGSRLFDLADMFSGNWFEFLNIHQTPGTQSLDVQLTGLEPAHVNDCKLTDIYFEIELSKDVDKGAGKSFISLVLPTGDTLPITLDAEGRQYFPVPGDINLKDAQGEYSISFNLTNTPYEWKSGDYLNTDMVKGMKLILFYQGQLSWV